MVNQVEEIASLAKKYQPEANVFVDAMSSFGAIPLNLVHVDFLVSSANKCIEGVPGFSYAISRKSKLFSCKGKCRLSKIREIGPWECCKFVNIFRKLSKFEFGFS